MGPLFKQSWISFTRELFVPNLVEIGPVVLEKKMKMRKVHDNSNDNDDNNNDNDDNISGELKM